MTGPFDSTRVRALVDRLSHGDRSIALALHSLIEVADENGAADFDRAVNCYRDDHLAALRVAGLDAEREAGRLSLDEVRQHLAGSVFPRLAAEGAIQLPSQGLREGGTIRFAERIWQEIVGSRAEIATVLRQTGEHKGVHGERSSTPAAVPAVMPGGSKLEARGLTKTYRRRRVVNNVALSLQQGEIVGLLGPNGAGKTTTFYMIVGLIQPLSGRIVLDVDK